MKKFLHWVDNRKKILLLLGIVISVSGFISVELFDLKHGIVPSEAGFVIILIVAISQMLKTIDKTKWK